MATSDEREPSRSVSPSTESEEVSKCTNVDLLSTEAELSLNVTREMLINAQQNDPS